MLTDISHNALRSSIELDDIEKRNQKCLTSPPVAADNFSRFVVYYVNE